MKKTLALFLTLVTILGSLGIVSFADTAVPHLAFNEISISQTNDVITIESWIANVGNTEISNLKNVTLKVYGKDGYVDTGYFDDEGLDAIYVKPGEAIRWTFSFKTKTGTSDFSTWKVEYDVKYTNVKTVTLPKGVKVFFQGKQVPINNSSIVESGRLLVPVKSIFEAMGARVYWNAVERSVTAMRGDVEVKLFIDSKAAFVNHQKVDLDVPPRVKNGTTLVPLKFISTALNTNLTWGASNSIVSIYE